MAGLEGTFNTPFGPVQKKTGLIIAGGATLILGIGYYRSRKASNTAATAAAGASVGIDPATGYLYGSPEDAAALTNQGSYITPGSGGGGGGGSASNTIGFVSNGQWSQAAIQYMTAQGLVEEPSQLSAALGKYINGTPVSTTEKSLIEQAIAFQGFPPVSGPSGYPPSVNVAPAPPGTTTPPAKTFTDTKVTVYPRDSVVNTVRALQAHGWKGVYNSLVELNPGMVANIHTYDTVHHTHPEWDYFINKAEYRLV